MIASCGYIVQTTTSIQKNSDFYDDFAATYGALVSNIEVDHLIKRRSTYGVDDAFDGLVENLAQRLRTTPTVVMYVIDRISRMFIARNDLSRAFALQVSQHELLKYKSLSILASGRWQHVIASTAIDEFTAYFDAVAYDVAGNTLLHMARDAADPDFKQTMARLCSTLLLRSADELILLQQYPSAISILQDAATLTATTDYPQHLHVANLLTSTSLKAGFKHQAQILSNRAHRWSQQYFLQDNLYFIDTLINNGDVAFAVGKTTVGMNNYLAAIAKIPDDTVIDGSRRARLLLEQAKYYALIQHYRQADSAVAQAGDIFDHYYGKQSLEYTLAQMITAKTYLSQNWYRQAYVLAEQAATIRQQQLRYANQFTAATIFLMAEAAYEQGKYQLAQTHIIAAQAMAESIPTLAVSMLARIYTYRSKIATRLHDVAQAKLYLTEALFVYRQHKDQYRAQLAELYLHQAELMQIEGFYPEARVMLSLAYQLYSDVFGTLNSATLAAHDLLSRFLARTKNFAAAEQMMMRSYQNRAAAFGEKSIYTLAARIQLGEIYQLQQQPDRANFFIERVYTALISQQPQSLYVAREYTSLAAIFTQQEQYQPAIQALTRAKDIFEKHLSPQHPDMRQVNTAIKKVGEHNVKPS